MVNGKTIDQELRQIEKFFNEISIKDLEKAAIECGAGIIVPSHNSTYVIAGEEKYKREIEGKRFCADAEFTVENGSKEVKAA